MDLVYLVQMETQELRSNDNAVFRMFLHLVLVTKYRRKLLTPAVLARCGEIAESVGCFHMKCLPLSRGQRRRKQAKLQHAIMMDAMSELRLAL